MAHHRHATARRTDDVRVVLEDLEELQRQRPRVLLAARVGHRLAATRLRRGKVDLDAVLLQHLDRGQADVRDTTGRCSRE